MRAAKSTRKNSRNAAARLPNELFYYIKARRKRARRKINDLQVLVLRPFCPNCSTWVKICTPDNDLADIRRTQSVERFAESNQREFNPTADNSRGTLQCLDRHIAI